MLAGILLGLSALAALYILAGYPLLLSRVRWHTAAPVHKDLNYKPSVSVIVAVHNGQEFVRAKIQYLLGLEYPLELMEILVVSDGSTDATDSIVESFPAPQVRLVRVPRGGKAAALNAGLQRATGEVVFFTDVRQPLHPAALAHLVANLADPTVGAATGELRILSTERTGEQADLDLYWRYELWARRQHSGIYSIFGATGCIYVVRKALATAIPADTLSDDVYIPLRVFLAGYRVVFEPEAVAFDYPTAPGGEFRRKLRTLAGVWQVHLRLPKLFTSGNRMRLHFLSHKFGRLVLPWVILLGLGATLALPASPTRTFLLLDELALVILATLDLLLPRRFPLKRLTSPARTFVAMNAASLLSIAALLVPPEVLWRPTLVRRGTGPPLR